MEDLCWDRQQFLLPKVFGASVSSLGGCPGPKSGPRRSPGTRGAHPAWFLTFYVMGWDSPAAVVQLFCCKCGTDVVCWLALGLFRGAAICLPYPLL